MQGRRRRHSPADGAQAIKGAGPYALCPANRKTRSGDKMPMRSPPSARRREPSRRRAPRPLASSGLHRAEVGRQGPSFSTPKRKGKHLKKCVKGAPLFGWKSVVKTPRRNYPISTGRDLRLIVGARRASVVSVMRSALDDLDASFSNAIDNAIAVVNPSAPPSR